MATQGMKQKHLARAAGLNETYVRDLLTGRSRNPRHQHLAKLADALDTTIEDLMSADGARASEAHTDAFGAGKPAARGQRTVIAEVDVRAEAGAGGLDPALPGHSERVVEQWAVPAELLRAHTTAGPERLRIIRVYGDSMAPMFRPGDRLLVDTSDRTPSPPGVFVLWDGLGIVVKRLEFIPYSDPPTVRVLSVNPAYEVYQRPLVEITVNGRVIARWDWT